MVQSSENNDDGMAQVTGKRNEPELAVRVCGTSDPLATHSDNVAVNDRRKSQMACSGDRDSVSSLPSTLAAYIRDEHEHSGGTDRCLALNMADIVAERLS